MPIIGQRISQPSSKNCKVSLRSNLSARRTLCRLASHLPTSHLQSSRFPSAQLLLNHNHREPRATSVVVIPAVSPPLHGHPGARTLSRQATIRRCVYVTPRMNPASLPIAATGIECKPCHGRPTGHASPQQPTPARQRLLSPHRV